MISKKNIISNNIDYFLGNATFSIMGAYLGQNFLIDSKIRHYIADHISSLYQDLGCEALIEIGPGKGSITKLIHQISKNFFVIEKDEKLLTPQPPSEWGSSTYVINEDVLDVDVKKILDDFSPDKGKTLESEKTLVVGNLPYYITSPILRKFFGEGCRDYAGGIFMVQDEVAQRLESGVKKKSYLWRLLNYAYEVKYLKGVPAKCFNPAPKVKSALIQLRTNNLQLTIKFEKLIAFLDAYSAFTRKTLGAISTMLTKKGSNDFIIPEALKKKRMEELTWEEMSEILE